MTTFIQKKINVNKILLTLLFSLIFLKGIFLYFSFNLSGLESLMIYIILTFIIYFRENHFNGFFKKLLLVSGLVTLISMLFKLESAITFNSLTFLMDNTPSIIETVKDLLTSVSESAPKSPQNTTYGPSLKPEIVDMWLHGRYRLLGQNLGEGAIKSMTVGGFLITCKPALLGTKTGKLMVASSSMIPFVDHIVK